MTCPNHQNYQLFSLPPRVEDNKFHSLCIDYQKVMSINDYLDRLFDFGEVSDEVSIVSLIYILRALNKHKGLRPEHLHKLTAGCLLLSQKFVSDDGGWSAKEYSQLTGLQSSKIKRIERKVLFKALEWDLYVTPEEFTKMKSALTQRWL